MKVTVLIWSAYLISKFSCDSNLKIELNTREYWLGEELIVDLTNNTCTNLPQLFKNRIISTKIGSSRCAQLYDELDCTGESIQLSWFSPSLADLAVWNFQNRTESIRFCQDPCVPIGGNFKKEIQSPIQIKLYSEAEWKGNLVSVQVDGCTTLNESLMLPYQLRSIQIPKDECVLAFIKSADDYDETPPVGSGTDDDCIVGKESDNVVAFQDGTPKLNDLGTWSAFHRTKFAIAFSPCSCNQVGSKPTTSSENESPSTTSESTFPTTVSPPKLENYIVFYSKINFQGDFIQIPLNFSDCKNLFEGEVGEWEGVAQSMKVSNGSCVEVYKESFCTDPIHVELTMEVSVPDLSQLFGMGQRIRSLKVCNKTIGGEASSESTPSGEGRNFSGSTMWITIACVGAVVASVLTFFLTRIRMRVNRSGREKLSDKEIEEFLVGLGIQLAERNEDEQDENSSNFENNEEESKLSSDLLAQNQPYNYRLEIPRNQLKFDAKGLIGSGEFGNVFKGTLVRPNEESVFVAIKTTKSHSSAQYLRALLKEVKVMMFVGQHLKIVSLVGCCTVNIKLGELFIVLEYCENGSLEKYIKENRDNFVNIVHKGQIRDNTCQQINPSSPKPPHLNYVQVLPELEASILEADETSTLSIFDIHQLINWSLDIAEGMEYLTMKKVIHGDLSARNVLLSSNLTAKVSDFGLSRKMYHYSQYTKNGTDPLPWRWLALESLKNLQFSTASDVWSYAVLLWEMFTLGETPYAGVSSLSNNFIINLEQGLRPTFPPFSTSEVYTIMSQCWDEEPKRRPSFAVIISKLKEIQEANENQNQIAANSSTNGCTAYKSYA